MSATAIQVPTRAAIIEKEWIKLFPKQVTENYTSSVTFVKQLTVIAVSTIMYLKKAFPEESYYSEDLEGLSLKILKDKCEDELAQFVSSSLKQAFEAFDKKYMHQLALCFYNGDCIAENLFEYYVFEYSYNSEGMTLQINSKNRNNTKNSMSCAMESVKKSTALFVRALMVFVNNNCQAALPVNFDVSLRLYYNEDSPEEYQAPGFCACAAPADHLAAAGEPMRLAGLDTPYHKVVARTFVRDLQRDRDAAAPSENQWEMIQADNDDFQADTSRTSREPDSKASLEPALRCPCGRQGAGDQPLITCQYCHTAQHAACFGLFAPAAQHCCAACAEAEPAHPATCRLLLGLERRKKECLCIFRRTLVMCLPLSSISGEEMMAKLELTAASTSQMIRVMQSHYVLSNADSNDLKIPRSINPLRLKLACKKFFRMDDHNIGDRMMTETETNTSDPVRIMLNNTSNLGNIAEKPDSDAAGWCDWVSSQENGRELDLPGNIKEDLPLSGSHNPLSVIDNPMNVTHDPLSGTHVTDAIATGRGKKLKRRKDKDDDTKPSKLPKLRSGVKNKKKI